MAFDNKGGDGGDEGGKGAVRVKSPRAFNAVRRSLFFLLLRVQIRASPYCFSHRFTSTQKSPESRILPAVSVTPLTSHIWV